MGSWELLEAGATAPPPSCGAPSFTCACGCGVAMRPYAAKQVLQAIYPEVDAISTASGQGLAFEYIEDSSSCKKGGPTANAYALAVCAAILKAHHRKLKTLSMLCMHCPRNQRIKVCADVGGWAVTDVAPWGDNALCVTHHWGCYHSFINVVFGSEPSPGHWDSAMRIRNAGHSTRITVSAQELMFPAFHKATQDLTLQIRNLTVKEIKCIVCQSKEPQEEDA